MTSSKQYRNKQNPEETLSGELIKLPHGYRFRDMIYLSMRHFKQNWKR